MLGVFSELTGDLHTLCWQDTWAQRFGWNFNSLCLKSGRQSPCGFPCIQKCFFKELDLNTFGNFKILINPLFFMLFQAVPCKASVCEHHLPGHNQYTGPLLVIVEHPLLALYCLHISYLVNWVLWDKLQCPVDFRRMPFQMIWVAALR